MHRENPIPLGGGMTFLGRCFTVRLALGSELHANHGQLATLAGSPVIDYIEGWLGEVSSLNSWIDICQRSAYVHGSARGGERDDSVELEAAANAPDRVSGVNCVSCGRGGCACGRGSVAGSHR